VPPAQHPDGLGVEGYLAYAATTTLIRHPYTDDLLRRLESENRGPARVPVESILRKDGTAVFFDLSHALRNITADPSYREIHDRLWLGGALLTLGDELADAGYFDKGHDLEFVRHLRNGIAHGNRFNLRGSEPVRPAYFTGPAQRLLADGITTTPTGETHTFEITSALQDRPVLFDFLGPGDVCDLLMFVGWRLIRIGNGDPPHPLWEQRTPE
jgi:hypothetical protein